MGKLLKTHEVKLVGIFIVSRILLFVLLFFLTKDSLQIKSFDDFILLFTHRWDGNSYTFIAKNWYVTQGTEATFIVFPPVYPILIKLGAFLFSNFDASAFLISNASFLGALILFYKLLVLEFKKNFAFWTSLILIIFPTSYYFSAGYPESTFFLLTSAAFYFALKEKFYLAGAVGGLAALTRPFGVVLWPALIYIILRKKGVNLKILFFVISMFLISTGLYLYINYAIYQDAFAFQKYLKDNWYKSASFPWEGIIGTWNRARWATSLEQKMIFGYSEAISATLAWVFIPLSFLKRLNINAGYRIYYLLGVVMFTSTSFILSGPRYLLSLPPFFIILAKLLDNRILRVLWIIFSLSALVIVSLLYAKGHWVY